MTPGRACRSYCGAAALSAILLSTVGAVWDELARILARKRSIRGYRLFVITPITTITLMHWEQRTCFFR